MAYIDYAYYRSLYGEKAIPEADFNRLSWDAEREIDKATSGVDNIKKLRVAFPVDEYDAESVKRCVSSLIELLYQIEQAEQSAHSAIGFIKKEDGTVQGKVVSSVSAGNESISYSVDKSTANAISTAIASPRNKELVVYDFIKTKLSGITDANGVNLLFAGAYPYREV